MATHIGAERIDLERAIHLLASPDSHEPLSMAGAYRLSTSDESETFPLRSGLPLLFPGVIQPYLGDRRIDFPQPPISETELQYFYISCMKMYWGEHNSNSSDIWYQKHLEWSSRLLASARGLVIDVGCDDPIMSASVFPEQVTYIGIDPLYENSTPFRLIGMAEFLPLRDESVDGACFMTSLDHVFDWHRAIAEARRVLKPDGRLYLATLVWSSQADLLRDHAHFHHFRERELLAGLSEHFVVDELFRTPWKDQSHRSVLYLSATPV